MLTMFIRALILYVAVIVIIRIMGKRQIGQLQPYELVFTLVVSDIVASPMADVGVPLFYSIMPIAALVLCYATMSILCLKSEKAREILTGRPTILVKNGVIDQTAMKKQSFSLSELMERVRESGLYNLHEVGCAILEVNGQMSVFPVSQKRALSPVDMGIQTEYEGVPLNLVLDGRVQTETLAVARLDRKWLTKKLHEIGTSPENVYFCTLDTSGLMSIQLMNESKIKLVQAISQSEVIW